ncbi:MAG TPA: hypothetical protein VKS21_04405, partial [Spirochaetota bacterium]|nr:hypothetical protein [Spirochaetota bacterium]
MKKIIVFLFLCTTAYSYLFHHQRADWYTDVPEKWTVDKEIYPAQVKFISPDKKNIVYIYTFPPGQFSSLRQFQQHYRRQLKYKGSISYYNYKKYETAVIKGTTDISNSKTAVTLRLFFKTDAYAAAILTCKNQTKENEQSSVLSLVDSFTPNQTMLYQPGIISSKIISNTAAGKKKPPARHIELGGQYFVSGIKTGYNTALKKLIKREINVLLHSGKSSKVLQRFYRMIYRTAYTMLGVLAQNISNYQKKQNKNKEETFFF